MGFRSRDDESIDEKQNVESGQYPRLDPQTVARIDNALEGTLRVDIANLSPDDKLTLLIERYNRKMRELQRLKGSDSTHV